VQRQVGGDLKRSIEVADAKDPRRASVRLVGPAAVLVGRRGRDEVERASWEVGVRLDGSPAFAYVIFTLDLGTAELLITEVLSALNLDHNDVLTTLAVAYTNEVPVVPDTDALAPQLEALERELFADGFTHKSGETSESRLVVTQYANVDVDSIDVLEAI